MKYSHDYKKLRWDEYTTIRRYPKAKVGRTVIEMYPSGMHHAKIVKIERKTLFEMDEEFLMKDTDCENKYEAIELIKSFYQKPIDLYKEKFYVYHLKKVKKRYGF